MTREGGGRGDEPHTRSEGAVFPSLRQSPSLKVIRTLQVNAAGRLVLFL